MKKQYRTNNEQSLGEAIDSFLKSARLKGRQVELTIVEQWESVMGNAIANHTVSIDLRRKVLYVKLDSASLRHELSLNREKIVKMMNDRAGDIAINSVKLI